MKVTATVPPLLPRPICTDAVKLGTRARVGVWMRETETDRQAETERQRQIDRDRETDRRTDRHRDSLSLSLSLNGLLKRLWAHVSCGDEHSQHL